MCSGGEYTPDWNEIYGNPTFDKIYLGLWAGDRIVIAGDYDSSNVNHIVSPSVDGFELNLYDYVDQSKEFENITSDIISWLTRDDETTNFLLERTQWDKELLNKLKEITDATKNCKLLQKLNRLSINNE